MRAVIDHAADADDESIAHLAWVLAESGTVAGLRYGSCDVASTGGPSSLTTLLSPLFLRELGHVVPKVGVPGRPAGAVDVLATIPGYRINFGHAEFASRLDQAGFCHALAGDDLAPLDGELFALRKQFHAVAVAPLVVASLLSKKLAVGLEHVVLDVRVWAHGNFGRDRPEARELAARFCRVADLAGVRATCVLTDAVRPYQPFIGRGESVMALHVALYGDAERWLRDHVELCRRIAAEASDRATSMMSTGRDKLRGIFETHLEAQGSSKEAFLVRAATVASEATTDVHSAADGFLVPDLRAIRSILVDLQARASGKDGRGYADPAGLRLLVNPETYVRRGDPIARVRHGGRAEPTADAVLRGLRSALAVRPEPSPSPAPLEVIRSAAR